MAYTFKKMKRGSYFGHRDDPAHVVYRKTGTYTFEECNTGEEYDLRDTEWDIYYRDGDGVFCLVEVDVVVKVIAWRPEW